MGSNIGPIGNLSGTDTRLWTPLLMRGVQPSQHGGPANEAGEGDEWIAYGIARTYQRDAPRDHLRLARAMVAESA